MIIRLKPATSGAVVALALIAAFESSPRAAMHAAAKAKLTERLSGLRARVISVEGDLIDSVKTQKEARANLKKIKLLLQLQKQEKELGRARMTELEKTIGDLESRRGVLRERIMVSQGAIRNSLREIHQSSNEEPKTLDITEQEKMAAARRRVLANLVERNLKEIEALKADLADADQLEAKIQDEKQQLAYLFHDLKEQEGVLELNQQLQAELLKQKRAERLAQLENYRKLKTAEAQVENLIGNFNARLELEQAVETERASSRAQNQLFQGAFARLRGKLGLPISGQIVSAFGKHFDPKSSLNVFKKGIDIAGGKNRPVYAVSTGRVAYSGELPDYGRVAIIDHGDHFYSLCAHLGDLKAKVGDNVVAGDQLGISDSEGTPIYFEIRARNVAVNPLQWVSN